MALVIWKRALQGLAAIVVASMILFGLVRLIPGDPSVIFAGSDASTETLAAVRSAYGLDKSIPEQYVAWATQIASGNLGRSFATRAPVVDYIRPTIVPTLFLLVGGVSVALVVAFTLGVTAAAAKRREIDAIVTGFAALLYGAPVFWTGLLAILLFAVALKWVPVGGFVNPLQDPAAGFKSLLLPWLVLGIAMGASLSRFVRGSFIEVLESDYIRLAQAKGASPFRVLRKHVFRNALVPIVTVLGVQIATLLGGAVIIETVFSWPGLGSLMMNAVNGRDYPTIQIVLLVYVVTFIVINFLTDVSNTMIDPRIRLEGEAQA
jgi:peptide/nickel transport system permease protein